MGTMANGKWQMADGRWQMANGKSVPSCQAKPGEYAGAVKKILVPLILMLVFAASRWPGLLPDGFSAAYAIVFCAGLYFPARLAWWVPLVTLLGTDILITMFHYGQGLAGFSWGQFAVAMLPNYIGYILLIAMGRGFGPKRSWLCLLGGGILGAILFYIVTNTASWLGPDYPKTFWGWVQALTTGLPGFPPTWEFFRNTLMSGGLFTGLFVGAIKVLQPAESAEEKREPVAADPEAEPEAEPDEAKA